MTKKQKTPEEKRHGWKRQVYNNMITLSSLIHAKIAAKHLQNQIKSNKFDDVYMAMMSMFASSYYNACIEITVPKRFLGVSPEEEQKAHEKIKAIRHNFIAHNDKKFFEVWVQPAGSKALQGASVDIAAFNLKKIKPDFTFNDLTLLIERIDRVDHNINLDLDDLRDKLYRGRKLPKDEFLLKF